MAKRTIYERAFGVDPEYKEPKTIYERAFGVEPSPPEQPAPEPEEDEGILGTVLGIINNPRREIPKIVNKLRNEETQDSLSESKDGALRLMRQTNPVMGNILSNVPNTLIAASAVPEIVGNAMQYSKNPNNLSAKYDPQMAEFWNTIGSGAHSLTDLLREIGVATAPQYKPHEKVSREYTSALSGGLGNLLDMLGADKAGGALNEISQATHVRDDERPAPELSLDYILHGLPVDTAQLAGSMTSIVPFMGLAPEALVARGVMGLGGSALERYLLSRGLPTAAKMVRTGLPQAARYGLTSAPVEGIMEGGDLRRQLLAQGYSPEEATKRAWIAAGENIPMLMATNTLEGLSYFTPLAPLRSLGKLGKGIQIGGRGLFNAGQEATEEAWQEAIQANQLGRDWGVLPFTIDENGQLVNNWSPEQWYAASHVVGPAGLFGLLGGAGQAMSSDEATEQARKDAAQRRSELTGRVVINEDGTAEYAPSSIYGKLRTSGEHWIEGQENNARQATREAIESSEGTLDAMRSWASKHGIGDITFNYIVRYANEQGIPPQRLLAQAIAESNGDQNSVSPVGAIGVMQLMPGTARSLGVDPYDLEDNIRGGAIYLRQQYDRFGDWDLAHAAYNAGPGAVEDAGNAIPNFSETQNYVARINDYMKESPAYSGDIQSRAERNYYGEGGKGEGKYWVLVNNGSYEGARPETMNLLDAMGKWVYDRAGKPVSISAVTNGTHAGGEYSHANGWKIDMHDGGLGLEGKLFTDDYQKGELADEFMEYWQARGVGVNLEGVGTQNVHFDISTAGYQWKDNDGNTLAEPFYRSGYSPESVAKAQDSAPKQNGKPQPARQEQEEEQPIPPLFDLNAEDDETKKLFAKFAEERRKQSEQSTGADAAADELFFSDMFTAKGKFKNTKENRDKIRNDEHYGAEFTAWATALLAQQQQAQQGQQQEQQPVQPTPTPQQTDTNNNHPVIKSAQKYLKQLQDNPSAENAPTRFALEKAINDGDMTAVQKILSKHSVQGQQEQQPAQGQQAQQTEPENVVQSNGTPENKLTQPPQQQQESPATAQPAQGQQQPPPEETQPAQSSQTAQGQTGWTPFIESAMATPVKPKDKNDKDAKADNVEQGKKLITLAGTYGVDINDVKASLQRGAPKAIAETQMRLYKSDKFPSRSQPQQQPKQLSYTEARTLASGEISTEENERKAQGKALIQVIDSLNETGALDDDFLPQGRRTELIDGNATTIDSFKQALAAKKIKGFTVQQAPQETTPATAQSERHYGNEANVYTAQNTQKQAPYKVRYRVAEADEIKTSHRIENGDVIENEGYPEGIQNRSRDRVAMKTDAISMANKLNPELLLDDNDANQGAPIVNKEGIVLNGNGRTMGIRYAYENGQGDAYKAAIVENADKLGLNADEIRQMKQPVLVREVAQDLRPDEFEDLITSQTGGSEYSPSERAKVDAKKIAKKPTIFNSLPQSGNLNNVSAGSFLQNLFQTIVGNTSLNGVTDNNGRITENGIRRATNALFSLAYGDDSLTKKQVENSGTKTNGILNALAEAAPTIARVQALMGMKNAPLHSYDLSVIAKAVNKLDSLRTSSTPISLYLESRNLFGAAFEDSDETKAIVKFLNDNNTHPEKFTKFLTELANGIQAQGNPNQGVVSDEMKRQPASLMELIQQATQAVQNKGQASLFDTQGGKNNATASQQTAPAQGLGSQEDNSQNAQPKQTSPQADEVKPKKRQEGEPNKLQRLRDKLKTDTYQNIGEWLTTRAKAASNQESPDAAARQELDNLLQQKFTDDELAAWDARLAQEKSAAQEQKPAEPVKVEDAPKEIVDTEPVGTPEANQQQDSTPEKATNPKAEQPKKKNKGKWHIQASASSREALLKIIREHYGNNNLVIEDDGTVREPERNITLRSTVRNNKGRWQFGYYESDTTDTAEAKPAKPQETPKTESQQQEGRDFTEEEIALMNTSPEELVVDDKLREKLHQKFPEIKEAIDVLVDAGKGNKPVDRRAAGLWLRAKENLKRLLAADKSEFEDGASFIWAANTMRDIWGSQKAKSTAKATAVAREAADKIISDAAKLSDEERRKQAQDIYQRLGEVLYPEKFKPETKAAKPKGEKKNAKRLKLHEKLKTDTHPNLRAWLDNVLDTAAQKEDTPERSAAIKSLKELEQINYSDEELSLMDKSKGRRAREAVRDKFFKVRSFGGLTTVALNKEAFPTGEISQEIRTRLREIAQKYRGFLHNSIPEVAYHLGKVTCGVDFSSEQVDEDSLNAFMDEVLSSGFLQEESASQAANNENSKQSPAENSENEPREQAPQGEVKNTASKATTGTQLSVEQVAADGKARLRSIADIDKYPELGTVIDRRIDEEAKTKTAEELQEFIEQAVERFSSYSEDDFAGAAAWEIYNNWHDRKFSRSRYGWMYEHPKAKYGTSQYQQVEETDGKASEILEGIREGTTSGVKAYEDIKKLLGKQARKTKAKPTENSENTPKEQAPQGEVETPEETADTVEGNQAETQAESGLSANSREVQNPPAQVEGTPDETQVDTESTPEVAPNESNQTTEETAQDTVEEATAPPIQVDEAEPATETPPAQANETPAEKPKYTFEQAVADMRREREKREANEDPQVKADKLEINSLKTLFEIEAAEESTTKNAKETRRGSLENLSVNGQSIGNAKKQNDDEAFSDRDYEINDRTTVTLAENPTEEEDAKVKTTLKQLAKGTFEDTRFERTKKGELVKITFATSEDASDFVSVAAEELFKLKHGRSPARTKTQSQPATVPKQSSSSKKSSSSPAFESRADKTEAEKIFIDWQEKMANENIANDENTKATIEKSIQERVDKLQSGKTDDEVQDAENEDEIKLDEKPILENVIKKLKDGLDIKAAAKATIEDIIQKMKRDISELKAKPATTVAESAARRKAIEALEKDTAKVVKDVISACRAAVNEARQNADDQAKEQAAAISAAAANKSEGEQAAAKSEQSEARKKAESIYNAWGKHKGLLNRNGKIKEELLDAEQLDEETEENLAILECADSLLESKLPDEEILKVMDALLGVQVAKDGNDGFKPVKNSQTPYRGGKINHEKVSDILDRLDRDDISIAAAKKELADLLAEAASNDSVLSTTLKVINAAENKAATNEDKGFAKALTTILKDYSEGFTKTIVAFANYAKRVAAINAIQAFYRLTDAWHGSPNIFSTFSLKRAGKGAAYGKLSHGVGIYFTTNTDEANFYREAGIEGANKKTEITIDGKRFILSAHVEDGIFQGVFWTDENGNRVEMPTNEVDIQEPTTLILGAIELPVFDGFSEKDIDLREVIKDSQGNKETIDKALKLVDDGKVQGLKISDVEERFGAIYHVKLPLESSMLDAEATWGQQKNGTSKKSAETIAAVEAAAKEAGVQLKDNTKGIDIYKAIAKKLGSEEKASELLHKHGVKGITYKSTYKSETDNKDFVIFNENDIIPIERYSRVGSKGKLENIIARDELTPEQKAIVDFCEQEMGIGLHFFRSDPDIQGVYSNGVAFINVNAKATPEWIFHHEVGHWLAHDNPQLFNNLVKMLNITAEQRDAYRQKIGRPDMTDDEANAEILCDMIGDIAQLKNLFKKMGKENYSLAERAMKWFVQALNRFTEFFFGKRFMTRTQRDRLYDRLGEVARAIADKHGNKKLRYNNRTRAIERIDGTPLPELPETKANKANAKNYSFAGENAKTADIARLEEAKRMEAEGKTPDEIFKKTGWFKGKDKKWRFEIPDPLGRMYFSKFAHARKQPTLGQLYKDPTLTDRYPDLVNAPVFKLGEIYRNNKLYEAYPEMRDINIVVVPERVADNLGGFSMSTGAINGDVTIWMAQHATRYGEFTDYRPYLIHELQHVIQNIEDFATGGSLSNIRQELEDRLAKMNPESKEAKELKTALENYNDVGLYYHLGGEQEANIVAERAKFKQKRKETPHAHEDNAIIAFGLKGQTTESQSEQDRASSNTESTPAQGTDDAKASGNNNWTDSRINEIAKNPNAANGLRQLGATIKNGKVSFPDSKTRTYCVNFLKDITDPNFKFAIAWHGSPYVFNEFSTFEIGTGEGGQIHGWGLYFASERGVSDGYRKGLGNPRLEITMAGHRYTQDGLWLKDENGDKVRGNHPLPLIIDEVYSLQRTLMEQQEAVSEEEEDFDDWGFDDEEERDSFPVITYDMIHSRLEEQRDKLSRSTKSEADEDLWALSLPTVEDYEKALKLLEDSGSFEAKTKVGSLYKVEIPDEDVMLDEQETLDNQPPKVQAAVREIAKERGITLDDEMYGHDIYYAIEKSFRSQWGRLAAKEASLLLNKHGVKGIAYDGELDGYCYVVFDDKAIQILERFSRIGPEGELENLIDDKDLNPLQKAIVDFCKSMGVPVVFFRSHPDTQGAFGRGTAYINVNSAATPEWVFHHEVGHWLAVDNPQIFNNLVKMLDITDKQRNEYRKQTKQYQLNDDEVDAEILCNKFGDEAELLKLFKKVGKDDTLVERALAWFKQMIDKFTDYFFGKKYFTRTERDKLYDSLGKIVRAIVDKRGNKKFRYNNRTHAIERADGTPLPKLPTTKANEAEGTKYSFAGRKAKTADKESLDRAIQMKEEGATRDEIFEETGWFTGKDGKWRFEIPDHREQMNLNNLIGLGRLRQEFKLAEIYNNPELLAAYPKQLNKVTIKAVDPEQEGIESELIRDSFAATIGNKIIFNADMISLDIEECEKTLVHEIQHLIQGYEKFADGGSPQTAKKKLIENRENIKQKIAKIANGRRYFKAVLANIKAHQAGNNEAEAKANQAVQKAKEQLTDREQSRINKLALRFLELEEAIATPTRTKEAKIELYNRFGGEQEAENVAERLDNREGTPVAHYADALVVFSGKNYAMVKASPKASPLETKKAAKNGERESFGGSKTPPAVTANSTTDRDTTNVVAGTDNKGGVVSRANVENDSLRGELSDGSITPSTATANGTTMRNPSETDVQADNKGGVRPSSANVETNSLRGELVFDRSETLPAATANSTTEATDTVTNRTDDKGGVSSSAAKVETNSPSKNITRDKGRVNEIGDNDAISGKRASEQEATQETELERDFRNARHVPESELKPHEKLWVKLGETFGVKVVWIESDNANLSGATEKGVIYLNRKAVSSAGKVAKTFWHEQFHIIKAVNPKLYRELLKYFTGKLAFTKEQLDAYRQQMKRPNLTDAEVIEEILCDNFGDVQKRARLMQEMSKDNPGLIKRFIALLKYMADKVVSLFHNPQGGMTTAQRDAFIKGIGDLAGNMKDVHGNKLFTVYKNGKEITLANGEPLPNMGLKFKSSDEQANSTDSTKQSSDNSKAETTPAQDSDEAQGEQSLLDKATKKFAKAIGFEHSKIVRAIEQRKAERKTKDNAMDELIRAERADKENSTKETKARIAAAKKRLKELQVSDEEYKAYKAGEQFRDYLNPLQYLGASPSRIGDAVRTFRAFYQMADRALDKLIGLRERNERRYNDALNLVTKLKERETLFALLWQGDAEGEEYGKLTKDEVEAAKANRRAGETETKAIQRAKVEKICKEKIAVGDEERAVSESVARAYLKVREIMTSLYIKMNKARRHPQQNHKYLSKDKIEELHDNIFVTDIVETDTFDSDGKRLVHYKECANYEESYFVNAAGLARLQADAANGKNNRDEAVQILDAEEIGKGKYLVTVRKGIGDITKVEGYIPHFFHEYAVVVKNKDGNIVPQFEGDKTGVLFTGRTELEAFNMAKQWEEEHRDELGDNKLYITPRGVDRVLGIDPEEMAPAIGDKDYAKMANGLAKKLGMTVADAERLMQDVVKKKARHRDLRSLQDRTNATGFIQDMDWVLRHYIQVSTRYIAMESEFKPHAIGLFERVFGSFDADHSNNSLARYTKNFINDVNGNPRAIELMLNKTLNNWWPFRQFIEPTFGRRGVLTFADGLTRMITYLKLGMFNVSSALLNLTQLINSGAYLDDYGLLAKHINKLREQRGKLTQTQLRILHESGVLNDLGLDTTTGFDKSNAPVLDGFEILWAKFKDNKIGTTLDVLDTLGNKSMILFQQMDSLCRVATTLAAYEKATAEGKSRTEAIKYAKKINRDANFSYGVEDAPNIIRQLGPIGKIVFQFKKYSFKEMEVILDMLPTNSRTSFTQKMRFWFPYFLACGLCGIIPLGDWLDEFLNDKFNLFPKDFMQEVVIKGSQEYIGGELGKKVADILMYGGGAVANVDMSRRAGMASILPQDFLTAIIGPTGSTLLNTASGIAKGDTEGALQSFSPGIFNIYAAIQGSTTDRYGKTKTIYENAYDRLIRAMGFRSVDESAVADMNRIRMHERGEYSDERQRAMKDFYEDRSPENARRMRELGITKRVWQNYLRARQEEKTQRYNRQTTKRERISGVWANEYLNGR